MRIRKQLLSLLLKSSKPLGWALLSVVIVIEIQRVFSQLKVDWYTAIAAALGITVPIIWDWIKGQIATVHLIAEENRKAISSKFNSLDTRIDSIVNQIERLSIQQQVDEQMREEIVQLRIEVERLKGDVNLGERLRFVEQIIYRFTNEKNTNH